MRAVQPSIGSVGDCYDNAMCESFFATLECELLDRVRFRTQSEARIAIFDFIEGFYNPRRRHSAALGSESPRGQLWRRTRRAGLSYGWISSSTLRFCERPSRVALFATGLLSP